MGYECELTIKISFKCFQALEQGSHAQLSYALAPDELGLGKWYRSKETLEGVNPFAGYLTNKKWLLNEACTKEKKEYILHFINLTNIIDYVPLENFNAFASFSTGI